MMITAIMSTASVFKKPLATDKEHDVGRGRGLKSEIRHVHGDKPTEATERD